MKSYELLIGDGNGAASRGFDGETLYVFHAVANSLDEAIDECKEQIQEIDRFDDYENYLEDNPNLTYHDYFNEKQPDGGDIWLVAYMENGDIVDPYDMLPAIRSGEEGEFTFNNPRDARLFHLPSHIKDDRERFLKNLAKGMGVDLK